MLGITKSNAENPGEIVVHMKDEYDYRIRSDNRDQVIDTLK